MFTLFQIKENHRQEEKSYRDFCDYVNRTSDYSALIVSEGNGMHFPVIEACTDLLVMAAMTGDRNN